MREIKPLKIIVAQMFSSWRPLVRQPLMQLLIFSHDGGPEFRAYGEDGGFPPFKSINLYLPEIEKLIEFLQNHIKEEAKCEK